MKLDGIREKVFLDRYSLKDKKGFLDKESYKLTKTAVATIKLIAEKYGHVEAQRAIMKSKTIEELIDYKKDK